MFSSKNNNWLFFNQPCFLCRINKSTAIGLCEGCYSDLPQLRNPCPNCALPQQSTNATCLECRDQPQAFDSAWAPLLYQFPMAAVLSQIKQGKNPNALYWMAALMADLAPPLPATEAFTLIPIPMHPIDRLLRGFNQTEILCRQISHKTGLPLDLRLLHKCKRTKHQAELNRSDRLTNLQRSFKVSRPPPEQVILIDDVMTTGATAICAAKALKEAGCKKVYFWACCRTP